MNTLQMFGINSGVIFLPLNVGETYDLFLTSKIWQRWLDVTPEITLQFLARNLYLKTLKLNLEIFLYGLMK